MLGEDDGRIQVDVRNLPDGVKPKLKSLAREAGIPFTKFLRQLLIERAGRDAELRVNIISYEPIR